jgi:hypothetical protein
MSRPRRRIKRKINKFEEYTGKGERNQENRKKIK